MVGVGSAGELSSKLKPVQMDVCIVLHGYSPVQGQDQEDRPVP